MNPTALVARILQPLARSLEEAGRHLDLEAAESGAGADEHRETSDRSAAPGAPPQSVPAPPARAWRPARSAGVPPLGGSTAASPPSAPAVPSRQAEHTRNAAQGAPFREAPRATQPPLRFDLRPAATLPAAAIPASPLPAHLGQTPSPPALAPGAGSDAPRSPPDAPRFVHRPPVAGLFRLTPAGRAPSAQAEFCAAPPPGPVASPADFPAAPPARSVAAPFPPSAAPQPSSTPQPSSAARPALPGSPAVRPGGPAVGAPAPPPAPRSWRVRPAPSPAAARDERAPPVAAAPARPAVRSRNPALSRVMQAMDPVFEQAWQLTDAALAPAQEGPDSALPPGAAPADAPDTPRVTNHFHVSVALSGDADGGPGREPQQFEDALVALLRDAARRQGLDV